MESKAVKVGDIVKWARPTDANEAKERFILVEHNGDRGFVEFICDMRIKPQQLVRIADIIVAEKSPV